MTSKPRLPKGAAYIGNGPVSTVFEWHNQMWRFGQGRRGGIIYRARPQQMCSLIARSFRKRAVRRNSRKNSR